MSAVFLTISVALISGTHGLDLLHGEILLDDFFSLLKLCINQQSALQVIKCQKKRRIMCFCSLSDLSLPGFMKLSLWCLKLILVVQ